MRTSLKGLVLEQADGSYWGNRGRANDLQIDAMLLASWSLDPASIAGLAIDVRGGPIFVDGAWALTDPTTLALADDAINYVERDAAGVVSANVTAFTDDSVPIAIIPAVGGAIDVPNILDARGATNAPWSGITGTPTTLGGYGITDAYTQAETDILLAAGESYADGVAAAAQAAAEAYADGIVAAAIATAEGYTDSVVANYLPLAGGTLTGNLLFSTDNTKDIGAAGATRPRTGYFGTSLVLGTDPGGSVMARIGGSAVVTGLLGLGGVTAPVATLDVMTTSYTAAYLRGANVAHGMTDVFPTNVYGYLGNSAPASGGLSVWGATDNDGVALDLTGLIGSETPSLTTPAVTISGQRKNATNRQRIGNTGRVLELYNFDLSLFHVRGDGLVVFQGAGAGGVYGQIIVGPDPGGSDQTRLGGAATVGTTLTALTSLKSPLLDSGSATDLLLKRNAVLQLTLGSLLATFAGDVDVAAGKVYKVNTTQVVAARRTGWTDQTATAARTDLGTTPTVDALSSAFRALYDDLKTHGLIGN